MTALLQPGSFPRRSAHNLLPHFLSLSPFVRSVAGRKARALYACKAEHDSELSFIAGTIFENGESGFGLADRKERGKNVGRCLCRNKQSPSDSEVVLGNALGFIQLQ